MEIKNIIGVILLVVIGVSLIPVISSLLDDATTTFNVVENVTLVNNTATSLTYDDINKLAMSQGARVLNETEQYTADDTTGTVTLIVNDYNGTATATYDYYKDSYMDSGTGRVVLPIILILFVEALLMMVWGFTKQ